MSFGMFIEDKRLVGCLSRTGVYLDVYRGPVSFWVFIEDKCLVGCLSRTGVYLDVY